MATWIVSAGAKGRDYADYFFRFGMAFVGGDSQRAAMMRVTSGDVILLKRGLSELIAAGTVVERNGVASGDGDKDWLLDFDGWDLPSYCHVEWHVPDQPEPATGLKMGTIYQTNQPQHLAQAQKLLAGPVKPAGSEPNATNPVNDEQILRFLISEGLRPSAADELTNTVRKIRLLADYYYQYSDWNDIREHETRTFLVVPLLIALGWAEQQIKVELSCSSGRIDVACFSRAYRRKNDECVVLIETKDFGSGLDYAPDQARRYAQDFPACQVLLVSNGWCYKTFLRTGKTGSFRKRASAYLNILRPRDRYPLDPEHVDGALGVMKWLLPSSLR